MLKVVPQNNEIELENNTTKDLGFYVSVCVIKLA